eukprot:jgi/Ulvmu1/151/UM001_0155.1
MRLNTKLQLISACMQRQETEMVLQYRRLELLSQLVSIKIVKFQRQEQMNDTSVIERRLESVQTIEKSLESAGRAAQGQIEHLHRLQQDLTSTRNEMIAKVRMDMRKRTWREEVNKTEEAPCGRDTGVVGQLKSSRKIVLEHKTKAARMLHECCDMRARQSSCTTQLGSPAAKTMLGSVAPSPFPGAMSSVQSQLLEILHEVEAQRKEVYCAFDVAVRTAEQLQTVRALESDRNRRASKRNEEHIQARLQAVRARKQQLKQQLKEWDETRAQKLSDVMSCASARMDLPKVLEDATNTMQRHRAERVDAHIRTVALEEELKILKEQQSEAEHARMTAVGELEILKMQHESLKEQHQVLEHEMTHARTLKEASAESARFYKEQLDESTFRLQAAETHILRLQQTLDTVKRDAAAEDALLKSLQARWAEQSKHIEEAAVEVANMRANVLADVATQTDYYVAASRNAQGSAVLHAQLAASWRREEKWRSEKIELLQQLQATATPAKCSSDPVSPCPAAPASAPASCHCSPLQSAASGLASPAARAEHSSIAPPCLAKPSATAGTTGTPDRTSVARSSGSVAQVDTPMPASPGRGVAAQPRRSPDSPAVRFPLLPTDSHRTGAVGHSGLDSLLHAAAAAQQAQGAMPLGSSAAECRSSDAPGGVSGVQPVVPVATPAGQDVLSMREAGAQQTSARPAAAGVRGASGKPPRPPGLFSALHLQPRVPEGDDMGAGFADVPAAVRAQGTRSAASVAGDGAEDVWDQFITDVVRLPSSSGAGDQQPQQHSTPAVSVDAQAARQGFMASLPGSETSGSGLDSVDDMLSMLLAEGAAGGDDSLLAMVAGPTQHVGSAQPNSTAGGAAAAASLPHEASEVSPPWSPVRGKRQRSPEAPETMAASVPVFVHSSVSAGGGAGEEGALLDRGGSDAFEQSIGACLRAISLPSVSSTEVTDLPPTVELGGPAGRPAGAFADVFGDLDAEASSLWGDACSADVEEVSVGGQEATLAHGWVPWPHGYGIGSGVRVVRHSPLASGAAQGGDAGDSPGAHQQPDESSPFGSVLLEEVVSIARPLHVPISRSAGPSVRGGQIDGLGEYVVPPQLYSTARVGPKAVALRDLEICLGERDIQVEKSVSLQFGSLKKMLQHHPENSEVEYLIRRIQALRSQAKDLAPESEEAVALKEEVQDRLTAAELAFSKLKLPEAVRNEFVTALVQARARVPVTQDGWMALEAAIGDAAGRALAPMVLRGSRADILDEKVSLLVRDPSQRAYDMTILVDATRQVYAEVRIPHCADRGIGALWDGESRSAPRTVHHPCPVCTTPSGEALVELDGELFEDAAEIEVAEQPHGAMPARSTFEGDNLLVVPAYRQKLFQQLGALGHSVRDATGSKETLRVTGFVAPDMSLVVSWVEEEGGVSISDKPWDLNSRCAIA